MSYNAHYIIDGDDTMTTAPLTLHQTMEKRNTRFRGEWDPAVYLLPGDCSVLDLETCFPPKPCLNITKGISKDPIPVEEGIDLGTLSEVRGKEELRDGEGLGNMTFDNAWMKTVVLLEKKRKEIENNSVTIVDPSKFLSWCAYIPNQISEYSTTIYNLRQVEDFELYSHDPEHRLQKKSSYKKRKPGLLSQYQHFGLAGLFPRGYPRQNSSITYLPWLTSQRRESVVDIAVQVPIVRGHPDVRGNRYSNESWASANIWPAPQKDPIAFARGYVYEDDYSSLLLRSSSSFRSFTSPIPALSSLPSFSSSSLTHLTLLSTFGCVNSDQVIFHRNSFFGLYLPSHEFISLALRDTWRGFFLQRVLWHHGKQVAFYPSFSTRNINFYPPEVVASHFNDAKLDLSSLFEELLEDLVEWDSLSSVRHPIDDFEALYSSSRRVHSAEKASVSAWIRDIRNLQGGRRVHSDLGSWKWESHLTPQVMQEHTPIVLLETGSPRNITSVWGTQTDLEEIPLRHWKTIPDNIAFMVLNFKLQDQNGE
jgi:hypothetical protein